MSKVLTAQQREFLTKVLDMKPQRVFSLKEECECPDGYPRHSWNGDQIQKWIGDVLNSGVYYDNDMDWINAVREWYKEQIEI